MPGIKIHNFDALLMKLQRGESALKDRLIEQYKTAIDMTAIDLVRTATEFLNKPGWQLSQSIRRSKIKEYQKRRILFQAVEPAGSKDPKPNTPAAYAWYHEHGYTVSASNVRRPRSGRIIRPGNKRAAYRRTEPKWFFKGAADALLPKLREDIARINAETKLELK